MVTGAWLVPSPRGVRWRSRFRANLIQSDSVGRQQPFSTRLFFDWILLGLLIVSRADFIVFVLFLEAVGVREYGCVAVESRLEALLRVFSASNACFARDQPSSKQVGVVGLSREPPNLRSWRCVQPTTAKATAGVAVVGKMTSIPCAAPIV